LSAFEENITTNIRNISDFQKLYIPESEEDLDWKRKVPRRERESLRGMEQSLKLVSQEMEDVRMQLEKRREDIKALRDGVSNKIAH